MKLFTLPLLLATLVLSGCSSGQNKETLLGAAGFRTIVPTTPKQITKVKSLPQLKVLPINKKGQTYFIFADASRNMLLIGNQKQYTQYQQYALQYNCTVALSAHSLEGICLTYVFVHKMILPSPFHRLLSYIRWNPG